MARRKHDVDIGINAKDNASKNVAKVESRFQKLGKFLTVGFVAAAAAAAAAITGLVRVMKSPIMFSYSILRCFVLSLRRRSSTLW